MARLVTLESTTAPIAFALIAFMVRRCRRSVAGSGVGVQRAVGPE
jgi:hypothetical protein